MRELSYHTQIRRLRNLAQRGLSHFPLKIKSLDFIQHGENTTYKVTDTENQKYLLRIHRLGYHSKAGIHEELKWLERINKTTDILAPIPLRAINGSYVTSDVLPIGNEQRFLTLLKWVDGRQLKKSISDAHVKEIGKLTAELHSHTKNKKVFHRNYWSAEGLVGHKPFMGPMDAIIGLKPDQQHAFNVARFIVFDRLSNYEKKYVHKMGLIHADLHFGNLFMNKGKISPIDFDDCGYGFHMYDLSVTMTSLQISFGKKSISKQKLNHLEDVLLDSYNMIHPLSSDDIMLIEDLKLARRFLGTQWLNLRADNPQLKKRSVPYARETLKIVKKSLGIK